MVDFPVPRTVTEVRQFIAMANQVAKLMPNLSGKLRHLRKLLRNDLERRWDAQQQQAFDQVKRDVQEAVALTVYDPKQELIVSVDASPCGLGAALLQRDEDGREKPVA
ncbi:hypothetical protein MTO96_039605 [Rhipicephalus appendiculatus]